MTQESNDFFTRWQQRIKSVEEEENTFSSLSSQQVSNKPIIKITDNETVTNEKNEEKLLTLDDLPDPSAISIGGSFAQFMAKNVDPIAKKMALRSLWKQPHFNEIDGLLEYGLDYSNQPTLSDSESAHLMKKVFRYVVDEIKENKEDDISKNIPTTFANEQLTQDQLINSNNDNKHLEQNKSDPYLIVKNDKTES